jgi:hypothetical protein
MTFSTLLECTRAVAIIAPNFALPTKVPHIQVVIAFPKQAQHLFTRR